jgi:hypothetical protein
MAKRKDKGTLLFVESDAGTPDSVWVETEPGVRQVEVCRRTMAAIVAPASLPNFGHWRRYRFTATPE